MQVMIAEDDTLLREGLTLLLRTANIEVLDAVDNAEDLLSALDRQRPDIAVVDVRLPPNFQDEGLRAAVTARQRYPGLPILVLSAHVEEVYAAELLATGSEGIGYVLKERVAKVEEFIQALHRVAAGGTAIDPQVVTQLFVRRRRDDPLRDLTDRQREVLALMAEGHDNADIAKVLLVSETAVSKHIHNIFTKLGLQQSGNGHRRVRAVLTYLNS